MNSFEWESEEEEQQQDKTQCKASEKLLGKVSQHFGTRISLFILRICPSIVSVSLLL